MLHSLAHLFLLANTVSSSGVSPVLYIFASALAGGGVTLAWNIWHRWRTGKLDDTELINRITQQTISGADDILSQYRIEVQAIKLQVEDYRGQLHDITRELAQATLRIAKLEAELTVSHADQERLRSELHQALDERERLRNQVVAIQNRIDECLEEQTRPVNVAEEIKNSH